MLSMKEMRAQARTAYAAKHNNENTTVVVTINNEGVTHVTPSRKGAQPFVIDPKQKKEKKRRSSRNNSKIAIREMAKEV